MKTILTLIFLSSLMSHVAFADFAQVEAQAKAYRDSGQLQRDETARAEAQRIALIPAQRRRFIQSVAEFANRIGGMSKRNISYDSNGSTIVEFTTRSNFSCRAQGGDMRCVNLRTMAEYYFFPQAPDGWSTSGMRAR